MKYIIEQSEYHKYGQAVKFDGGEFEQFEALVDVIADWCRNSMSGYGEDWWMLVFDHGWDIHFCFDLPENAAFFKLRWNP